MEVNSLSFTPDSLVVVQFPSPPSTDVRGTLLRAGYIPLFYQPDYAFISIETPGATPPPGVRAIYPLKAYLRASPDLIQEYERGEKEAKRLFVLFAHPSPSSIIYLSQVSYVEEAGVDYCVVWAAPRDLKYILKAPLLLWVEELAEVGLDNNVASDIIDVNKVRGSLNLTGRGVIVAVADTGLDNGRNDNTMHPDFRGRIRAAHAWGRSGNWSDADIHINNSGVITYKGGHGTHVAGSVLGNGSASNGTIKGMAPEAYLVIQSLMNATGSLIVPYNYTSLYSQAYSDGARIHTNSWSSRSTSTFGNYTTRSYYIDYYTWHKKNFTILYSAGNQQSYGNGSISTQATAKNCIAVGASENYRPTLGSSANNISQLAYFSSLGPTDDGRIKPDVVAPGTWILSTRSTLITDPWNHYWGSQSLYNSVNSYYAYMGGTSMSTPIVAGSVALLRQYMVEKEGHDPSSALLKALLINGARPLNGDLSSIPNNREGWGRINLTLSLAERRDMKLTWVDYDGGINTSATYTKKIVVQNSSTPLFITLVWTDFPASPTSTIALVNDLDLEVVLPNGTVYYGNDFSSPFNSTHDRRNNVERVHLVNPPKGIYTIRVKGYSVPYGPQPFALAITANTTDALGTIEWDRSFYRVGEVAHLLLSDSNLTGRGYINIFVNTTADPQGEWVNLTENTSGGAQGIFEGSVKIVKGSPGVGEVRAADNDTLFAYYNETYPSRLLKASAKTYIQPTINWVNHTAWNYTLTGGENVTVYVNGTPGREGYIIIKNLTGVGRLPLYDDGAHSDGSAGDGLYATTYTVPVGGYIQGNFTVEAHLSRPPLPDTVRLSPHPLRIDTFIPRRPEWLNVTPLPEGNSLLLTWQMPSDPNLLSFRIFRNSTTGFEMIHETLNTTPSYVDRGLTDGVRYTYYVVSRNVLGRLSRPSPYASGVPEDTLPPTLKIISPGEGEILTGEVSVNYTADNDTVWIALLVYRDLNGNGIPDDGEEWYEAVNTTNSVLKLNTTLLPTRYEGVPLLMRLKGSDEVGNVALSPPVGGITIDNTPPNWAEIVSERLVLTRVGAVEILLRGEGKMRVEVRANRSIVSSTVEEDDEGNYTITVMVRTGSTVIDLYLYDMVGNGPYVVEEAAIIHYDPIPPEVSFTVASSNTTAGLTLRSTSFDPVVISNSSLERVAKSFWNVSYLGEYFTGEGESFHADTTIPTTALVKLTVVDLFGNTNYTILRIEIEDTTPPTMPRLGPFTIEEDRPFSLSAEGVADNDPTFPDSATFRWNISGVLKEGFYVSFTFQDPGEFNGTLTAVDPSGNENTTHFTICVLDTTPPTIQVEIPDDVRAGEEVVLSARNTTDNSKNFTYGDNFVWEIPELSIILKGAEVKVTFPRRGRYTLLLTVSDSSSNNASIRKIIQVLPDGVPPLVESVEVEMKHGCISPSPTFHVIFSEPVDQNSLKNGVKITVDGEQVPVIMNLSSNGTTLLIKTLYSLSQGSEVHLIFTTDVEDLTGTPLSFSQFNFTVWRALILLDSPERITSPGVYNLTFSNDIEGVGEVYVLKGEVKMEVNYSVVGRTLTIHIESGWEGDKVVISNVKDIYDQSVENISIPLSITEPSPESERRGEGGGWDSIVYIPLIIIAL
ncbi:MAG: S8 family serine peptidase, partial [Thermoplasmata archaeon]|nr:S8 family serine peptidase [Thermoplasmata archaeon]